MKQYVVDAFTKVPFSGNPAAVCVMERWPQDSYMQALATENNLSETAFIVKEGDHYRLRWFTPGTEVDLCGHATLASSFVIFNFVEPESEEIRFQTRSGELIIRRKAELLEMNFPLSDYREIPVTEAMEKAFGAKPVKAFLGMDLNCVFAEEETVRNMNPDQNLLAELPGRLQNATAAGKGTDCVSRCFGPKVAVPEDPVTGSSHTELAPYWATEFGKKEIHAYQASKRGGHLFCEILEEGRIAIRGNAVLVAETEIQAVPTW